MPVVKISVESMTLLIANADSLEITVKDLLDSIIADHYGLYEAFEEEEEEEGEAEEEEEEEEEEESED